MAKKISLRWNNGNAPLRVLGNTCEHGTPAIALSGPRWFISLFCEGPRDPTAGPREAVKLHDGSIKTAT